MHCYGCDNPENGIYLTMENHALKTNVDICAMVKTYFFRCKVTMKPLNISYYKYININILDTPVQCALKNHNSGDRT